MSVALSVATTASSAAPRRLPICGLLQSRSFLIGAVLVLTIVLVAVFADLLSPFDPLRNSFRDTPPAPGRHHSGSARTISVATSSRASSTAPRISLIIGADDRVADRHSRDDHRRGAGFFPALDNPIMRLMDALMAFPAIVLAIAVAAVLGASVVNVIIALSIATMPHTARIVRASVLVVREREFIEAARALGASESGSLCRHVLPNAFGPLIVRLTYVFATAILAEAALSFIGVGPPPPAPSFGSIIAQGRDFITEAPWITIFPGLAIIVSVLGLNLLGDGLRDVLDPRMTV